MAYWRAPEFEVNDELLSVIVSKHFYLPLAGLGGHLANIVPVYYLPDQATPSIYIEGIDVGGLAQVGIHYKTFNRTIHLPTDSVFIHTIRTIEPGVVEQSLGDSCVWEYTDSLVIANHGLNPRDRISYIQW